MSYRDRNRYPESDTESSDANSDIYDFGENDSDSETHDENDDDDDSKSDSDSNSHIHDYGENDSDSDTHDENYDDDDSKSDSESNSNIHDYGENDSDSDTHDENDDDDDSKSDSDSNSHIHDYGENDSDSDTHEHNESEDESENESTPYDSDYEIENCESESDWDTVYTGSDSDSDSDIDCGAKRINNKKRKSESISNSVIELIGLMYDKNFFVDRHLLQSYYSKLNTRIECLGRYLEEYNQICQYVQNTHGPTHNFRLKVRSIFSTHRQREYERYKPNKSLGNRKLLWHGTNISNYTSILEKGLMTDTPSNVKVTGKMFGNGVYFADVVSKAAGYCDASSSDSKGLLILAEVALGNHYYRTESERIVRLPAGKNSVKGLGKYKPLPTAIVRNKYGAQIPLGTLIQRNDLRTNLHYNEYIVYNNNQILIQYLVFVDFEF